MADDQEKSDLQKDLEEKDRQRLAGQSAPTPPKQKPVGPPTSPEQRERAEHERERKEKVAKAIEARHPENVAEAKRKEAEAKQQKSSPKEDAIKHLQQQVRPAPEPRRDIPLLSASKHHQPLQPDDDLDPGQRLLAERARGAGVAVHATPPPPLDERTGRMNDLDGELRKQIARIDELYRRLVTVVAASSGTSCGAPPTVIANGSGDTAATNTFTSTGNGLVTLVVEMRDAYSSGGDEILYGFRRTITLAACAVSAEVRYVIDTPDDSDCTPT
jgi:hypothetical protein